jgi:hypothetical protein
LPVPVPVLGVFDMPPEELPWLPLLPLLEPVLEPLLPEPMLPEPVLEPEALEPDAPEPDLLEPDVLDPCEAFHSSRLSLPSWSLSSLSKDWDPEDEPLLEELPPEAALLLDDEGLLLLLWDMEGCEALLPLFCFAESLA